MHWILNFISKQKENVVAQFLRTVLIYDPHLNEKKRSGIIANISTTPMANLLILRLLRKNLRECTRRNLLTEKIKPAKDQSFIMDWNHQSLTIIDFSIGRLQSRYPRSQNWNHVRSASPLGVDLIETHGLALIEMAADKERLADYFLASNKKPRP